MRKISRYTNPKNKKQWKIHPKHLADVMKGYQFDWSKKRLLKSERAALEFKKEWFAFVDNQSLITIEYMGGLKIEDIVEIRSVRANHSDNYKTAVFKGKKAEIKIPKKIFKTLKLFMKPVYTTTNR